MTNEIADEMKAKLGNPAEKKPKNEAKKADIPEAQKGTPPQVYASLPCYFTNGIELCKGEKDADTDLLIVKNDLNIPLFRLIVPRKVAANLLDQYETE